MILAALVSDQGLALDYGIDFAAFRGCGSGFGFLYQVAPRIQRRADTAPFAALLDSKALRQGVEPGFPTPRLGDAYRLTYAYSLRDGTVGSPGLALEELDLGAWSHTVQVPTALLAASTTYHTDGPNAASGTDIAWFAGHRTRLSGLHLTQEDDTSNIPSMGTPLDWPVRVSTPRMGRPSAMLGLGFGTGRADCSLRGEHGRSGWWTAVQNLTLVPPYRASRSEALIHDYFAGTGWLIPGAREAFPILASDEAHATRAQDVLHCAPTSCTGTCDAMVRLLPFRGAGPDQALPIRLRLAPTMRGTVVSHSLLDLLRAHSAVNLTAGQALHRLGQYGLQLAPGGSTFQFPPGEALLPGLSQSTLPGMVAAGLTKTAPAPPTLVAGCASLGAACFLTVPATGPPTVHLRPFSSRLTARTGTALFAAHLLLFIVWKYHTRVGGEGAAGHNTLQPLRCGCCARRPARRAAHPHARYYRDELPLGALLLQQLTFWAAVLRAMALATRRAVLCHRCVLSYSYMRRCTLTGVALGAVASACVLGSLLQQAGWSFRARRRLMFWLSWAGDVQLAVLLFFTFSAPPLLPSEQVYTIVVLLGGACATAVFRSMDMSVRLRWPDASLPWVVTGLLADALCGAWCVAACVFPTLFVLLSPYGLSAQVTQALTSLCVGLGMTGLYFLPVHRTPPPHLTKPSLT